MSDPRKRGLRFFVALLVATLVPHLFFPLSVGLLAESPGASETGLGLVFLGSSGHVAASFFFYGDPRIRAFMRTSPVRFALAPLLVVAGSAVFLVVAGAWASYFVFGYWIWQTHHYTRQNHGILAFAGQASGAPIDDDERTAVTLTGVGGVIGALTFVAPYEAVGLGSYGWHLHAVALGTWGVGWIYWLLSLRRRRGHGGPMRAALLLVCMLFYAPLFLYEDPVAAVSSYAIAHGLQYLIFMSYVARVPEVSALRRGVALVAFVLLGGALLQFMQTDSFGPWRQAVFGAYLGFVMWHFLLDAGVWRLSDPVQRAYMAERFPFLARSAAR